MRLLALRAALVVAAVYGYFLLFAQFAFVALLRSDGTVAIWEKSALGLMAVAGIAGGFHAARRGPDVRMVRTALAAAGLAAMAASCAHGLIVFLTISLVTGVALGVATVALASLVRGWCGVAWVGLGTGIGYALCNLPAVFNAPSQQQAWMAAALALTGVIMVPAARRWAPESRAGTTLNPWAAITILTALVWLDSAAFFIIQHEQSLKQATWGDGMLWRNAALHLGVAVLTGQWLRRGRMTTALVAAWAILALAAIAVNGPDTRVLAGWWYPVGVSLYSTVMVAWPGWFSNSGEAKTAAWRAACLFAIAGWFGSANGIGMAESLHRVPVTLVAASGAATAILLGLHVSGAWRALVVVSAVAATVMLVSTVRKFAPTGLPDAARGRAVYVAEGCIHCHSQYVRPGTSDVELWGPAIGAAELLLEKPVLIGNRRQGPDLQNIGMRRSAAWLKEHFINPRLLCPDSTMPNYQHLFDDRRGADLIAYLKSRGADLTSSLAEKRNAWQPAATAATNDGQRLFSRHCTACHGSEGRGNGVLAKRLARPPANLAHGPFLWTTGTPAEQRLKAARSIKFGIPGTDMPGHEVFTDAQIQALTNHVMGLREKF